MTAENSICYKAKLYYKGLIHMYFQHDLWPQVSMAQLTGSHTKKKNAYALKTPRVIFPSLSFSRFMDRALRSQWNVQIIHIQDPPICLSSLTLKFQAKRLDYKSMIFVCLSVISGLLWPKHHAAVDWLLIEKLLGVNQTSISPHLIIYFGQTKC